MQDHIFESYEEEQERETVDSLAEWEHHFNARGDDRFEPSPFDFTTSDPHDLPASPFTAEASRPDSASRDAGHSGNQEEKAA